MSFREWANPAIFSPNNEDAFKCILSAAQASTSRRVSHNGAATISPIKTYAEKLDTVPYDQLDLDSLRNPKGYGLICPCCSRVFRDKFNFRDHYMCHSGEKPMKCKYCLYSCLRKKQLEIHIVSKHRNTLM